MKFSPGNLNQQDGVPQASPRISIVIADHSELYRAMLKNED